MSQQPSAQNPSVTCTIRRHPTSPAPITVKTPTEELEASIVHPTREKKGVVFLHGNSASKDLFEKQMTFCADLNFNAVAIDFPGHGESKPAKNPKLTYSMPGYAALIEEVINQLAWQKICLVGWSLGGHVALQILSQRNDITGCMIVGTPPVAMSEEEAKEAFLPSPTMNLAFSPDFSLEEARAYGQAMLGSRVQISDAFVRQVRATDGHARLWLAKNGIAGQGVDQKALVSYCDVPLAVVHGAEDSFVRLEYLQNLTYRNLWRSEVQVLDAGHAPHVEKPDVFNDLLGEFIRETNM